MSDERTILQSRFHDKDLAKYETSLNDIKHLILPLEWSSEDIEKMIEKAAIARSTSADELV
jgi:hypothetical protein